MARRERPDKPKKQFWPDTKTKHGALQAISSGKVGCYIIGVLLILFGGILTIGQLSGLAGGLMFLSGILYCVLGFYIGKKSRTAAALALGLFSLILVSSMALAGGGPGCLQILFLLMLINGVRGTFGYHNLDKKVLEVFD